MEQSVQRMLFNLGARLGSLEGYLYAGDKVEKKYLAGWLDNISREFSALPPEARRDVAGDYVQILEKVGALFLELYGSEDAGTVRVRTMVAEIKEGD